MAIWARFIGKTSCGFVSNKVYRVDMFGDEGYIWIKAKGGHAICPYSNLKTLAENWEIPAKDIREK